MVRAQRMVLRDSIAPALLPLRNLPFKSEDEAPSRQRKPPEAPLARPPGGVLMVAVLSAVSGAVMGLLLGGYLSIAAAVFATLPAGIVVGIWVRSLPD